MDKTSIDMGKRTDNMTVEELRAELGRLKDTLCDLEEMHLFTFGKTSVHIGAERAQNMQFEFDEECRLYNQRIAEIETALKDRDPRSGG